MGLESVELVMAWEDAFGIELSEAEAVSIQTPRATTDCIYNKLKSPAPEDTGCLAMRAFQRLRRGFQIEGIPRNAVHPDAKLAGILPGPRRRDLLNSLRQRAGLPPLRRLPFGLQFTSGRVRDLVLDTVIEHHATLRLPAHGWSRAQVREVIRAVMYAQLALRHFSDTAEFIRDLNIS